MFAGESAVGEDTTWEGILRSDSGGSLDGSFGWVYDRIVLRLVR